MAATSYTGLLSNHIDMDGVQSRIWDHMQPKATSTLSNVEEYLHQLNGKCICDLIFGGGFGGGDSFKPKKAGKEAVQLLIHATWLGGAPPGWATPTSGSAFRR